MKRFSIFSAAVVLITSQLACNLLATRPADSTPTAQAVTPLLPTPDGPTETPLPTEPTATSTLAPETPSSGGISLETLKNFSYWVEDFNIQAPLQNGVFSDDRFQIQFIEPAGFGDLNGDGQDDAAVMLAVKSGGTGTFYDLIAVLDQDGTPVQAGSTYVGDRQIVNTLQIGDGRIILDYITQGLSDPLCCPSEHRLSSYLLENGAVVLASEQILDSPTAQATPLPNAILIDQPRKADPLTSPLLVRGRVSQVPPEGKLVYFVTDMSATLLMEGEAPVDGEPGGPGSFAFEFSLGIVPAGLIQVEVVDAANGTLRGRSVVVVVSPP